METNLHLPIRLRRNRRTPAIRQMIQETHLSTSDFVVPLFVTEGTGVFVPIPSMPGIFRFSLDLLLRKIEYLHTKGIQAICLFPALEENCRSEEAEEAWNREGLMPRAIAAIKRQFPNLCVMADVALDPYTSHGHDGLVRGGEIVNDETIVRLAQMALVQAEAGVDFVAPSDMMDGRVKIIRETLDENGFAHVGILAYSAKYASSLYGPFREALNVNLRFGDKKKPIN